MNRTITKNSRSMKLHTILPKNFLENKVNTIMFVINKTPSISQNESLLKEAESEKMYLYAI